MGERGESLIYFVDDCLKIREKNEKGHVYVCDKILFFYIKYAFLRLVIMKLLFLNLFLPTQHGFRGLSKKGGGE